MDNGPALPLLLLTRPEQASRRFAQAMAETGVAHSLLIAPLSRVVPVAFDRAALTGAGGFIVTSANALDALDMQPRVPVFCVGPGTTRAARARGLDAVQAGQDAESLLATLLRDRPSGPLVHVQGAHLALDIVAALQEAGQEARGLQVYETQDLDLTEQQRERIAAAPYVVAPVFSPRGARALERALGGAIPPGMVTPAISAAAAVGPDSPVAASPDRDGMVRATRVALLPATRDAWGRVGSGQDSD